MKKVLHVLRMVVRNGAKIPSGIYGFRPGHETGIPVHFADNSAIKSTGYRLCETEIASDQKSAVTTTSLDPEMITQVITDLETQRRRTGAKMAKKIEAALQEPMYQGLEPITCVLEFKPGDNRGKPCLIARYSAGLNGPAGLIVFGNTGVYPGYYLVKVFFHREQACGMAVAVTSHGQMDTAIGDLTSQLSQVQYFNRKGYLPGSDKVKDLPADCRRMLKSVGAKTEAA